ncbi:MAG: tetratricopeptide repeat protein [Verrucomicrobiales bacterium]|nr:tetratricopeptide repeat protein [Verrucomicrobiales bacterium]
MSHAAFSNIPYIAICQMTEGQFHLLKVLRLHASFLTEGTHDPGADDYEVDPERLERVADSILKLTRSAGEPDSDPGEADSYFEAVALAGRAKLLVGKLPEAESLLREALEFGVHGDRPQDQISIAEVKQNLGSALDLQGNEDEATPLFEEALDVLQHSDPVPLETVANLSNNLGMIYRNRKQYEEAEQMYLRAVEIFSELPDREIEEALVHNNLGTLYFVADELDGARIRHEKALAMRRRLLPKKDIDIGQSAFNLAVVCHQMDELEEAEPLYKEATKILKQAIDDDPELYEVVMQNYATLVDSIGKPRAAAKILTKAARQLEKAGHTPSWRRKS